MKDTLSVITICFNNLPELIRTCQSVDRQSQFPDEHLVIDGSSDTEILNWLQSDPQPAYRKWIHEKDSGIADALNKGLRNAVSNITHLLHSGDLYYDVDAIKIVMEVFAKDPSVMWCHSQYIQHRGNIDIISGVSFDKNQLWKGMRTVAHPSMFIRKEIYTRHEFYNTNLKVAMDYDMLIRMKNEKFKYIERPLVYFAPAGASSTHFFTGLKEIKESHKKYIGYSFKQTLWQSRQKILHYFMQSAIGKKWFQWKNKNNRIQ
ncbi:MAG TPA: glycosyltransferase [Chitinophagaceae bacterium]